MKVLLIVAIVLAMQPTKPEDGKRASQSKTAQSTKQADSAQNDSDNPRSPSVSVTINNAPASPNTHSNEDDSNENMRIQHRLALYTGLLVFVGFVTAVVLIWQSVETHRATNAANQAATAALLNAQAIINSERAWVMVQVNKEKVETGLDQNVGLFGWSGFQFIMFNYGKTPAHILDCRELTFDFLERPDSDLQIPPQYGESNRTKKFLAPRDSSLLGSPFKPSTTRLQTVEKRAAIGEHTKGDFVVYGLIEYSDGVSQEVRRTAFCYRHDKNTLSEGGNLVPCGPPVYNEYT